MTTSTVKHGSRFINLEGKRFGRLVVLRYYDKPLRLLRWLCLCDCGKETIVQGSNLTNGHTISCGCYRVEVVGNQFRTHQQCDTKTYRIWGNMLSRCRSETNPAYKWYGERGIKVCERWYVFENFLADMGECPSERSLDRKDNNGNYEKDNCRWATAQEQALNKRNTCFVTFKGQTKPLMEWAEIYNIEPRTLAARLECWPVAMAFTRKVKRMVKRLTPEERAVAKKACQAVYRAISITGKLVRPSVCSKCGREAKTQAHHHLGYAKEHWLDVVWLCRLCHELAELSIDLEKAPR